MKLSRVRLTPVIVLPALLAACGGAGPTPTPPTPTVTPSLAPVASPSPAPSTASSPTPAATPTTTAPGSPAALPSASPFVFHADPELEAQLPVLVEGQAVRVETVPVSSLLQLMDPTSTDAHAMRRFLSEIGSDPAAVTTAFASYGSGENTVDFRAYRAPGSRPDHLLAATVYLMRTATGDAAGATIATTQVGNRTVTTVTGTGADPIVITVFVQGEIAVVTTETDLRLAALLDALP